ncbi:MAG: TonB-dependent receptor [Bacteroidia bacterium]|nr:TonB-dependent receptor [Bacteroidia bacterium]
MKQIFLIGIFFVLGIISVSAQNNTYALKAKVLAPDGHPLDYGNAIALHVKDSSIHKGVPFQNGEFILEGLSKDSLIIKITAIGFEDMYKNFIRTNNDSLVEIPTLQLKENNNLKEVTITAKTPMFEMDGEKVKVNVEATGLTSAGNALDVLRRSPGVSVNSSDVVSVLGKGTAIIYLDGVLITSNDILKSLPSADIKSIEIISNPSARYDAAGRAVINIITLRNNRQGYNGSLIQNTLYGKYFFSYSGLRLNITKGKWSVYLGYGANMGKQWNSDDYLRKFKSNDTTQLEMRNSIFETQNYSNVNYYRSGFNYRPDSSSVLGFQYSGFYNSQNNLSNNQNEVLQNGANQYQLKTNTIGKPVLLNHGFNANYSKKLDTLGTELFVAAQYGNFISNSISNISQQASSATSSANENKRNTNANDIKIFGAQMDFTKVFNKTWRLESGIKNSFVAKTSNIRFENYASDGTWVSDPAYLNGFVFNENISAVYSEARFKKNKFNMRLGGRSEYTYSDGFSKRLNQNIIKRNYINFFPSAFAGYDFTKDLSTSLTLSSRINRPTFQDLDPFINYIDSLTSFRGNPYLLPEYTNSIEASLIYMKEANITVGYNRTNGALRLVVDKLNNGTDAFTATTKNLKKSESYSFGITIPYELEWWTTANYFGYFLNTFSYEQNGILVNNYKPTFSIYLYNEFRFKKLFSMEVVYEYTSKAVDGIFISKPFSMLNATLKKSFFKDKLVCRFTAGDMLKSYIMAGQSNIPTYNLAYYSLINTHYYQLAINYKFGKLKNVSYKNKTVSDDEYNRIKMGK